MGKATATPTTYKVEARRDGAWWALTVPDVPGAFSQVKRLDKAAETVTEAIAMVLEVEESAVEVELVPILGEDQAAALARIDEAKAEAARAAESAAAATGEAVAALHEAMSMRDIGVVLGISHQRVHQLLDEHQARQVD